MDRVRRGWRQAGGGGGSDGREVAVVTVPPPRQRAHQAAWSSAAGRLTAGNSRQGGLLDGRRQPQRLLLRHRVPLQSVAHWVNCCSRGVGEGSLAGRQARAFRHMLPIGDNPNQ